MHVTKILIQTFKFISLKHTGQLNIRAGKTSNLIINNKQIT